MISRAEGYRRGAGKEEAALRVAEEFFDEILQISVTRITDRELNYELGDLQAAGGTIECKGQPVDPSRYRRNFVEVFEATDNPAHVDGLPRLAAMLGLSMEQIQRIAVADRRIAAERQRRVGALENVSVSIHTFEQAKYVVYINAPGRVVLMYRSEDLLAAIREAVRAQGLERGKGMSNEDTFAVMIGYPPMIWNGSGGQWRFIGSGSEEPPIQHARQRLLSSG